MKFSSALPPARFLRRIRPEKLGWLEFSGKPRAGAELSANITIKRGENVTEPRINCWFVPPAALFLAPTRPARISLEVSSSGRRRFTPSLSHLHASLPSNFYPELLGNRSFPRKIFISLLKSANLSKIKFPWFVFLIFISKLIRQVIKGELS